MAAPSVTLNNGVQIPAVGLGTYLADDKFHKAICDAIEAGYRHFDCAFFYGNEAELGKALRDNISSGAVTRAELFVTSKVWSNKHTPDAVVAMCKKSNDNLGLGYIDLFLVHWPFAFKQGEELIPINKDGIPEMCDIDYLDTWTGMEQCVGLGLARSIGLSNFNSEQIERLLKAAKIKPVCNQVECSPSNNQKKLIKFCKERDIVVVGHTPLSRPDWEIEGKPKNPIENAKVIKMAKKYNKSSAQVVLRYLFENGVVLIPKSVTKSRIQSNIDIFDFKLTNEDRSVLDGLHCNYRVYSFSDLKHDKYYPFNLEY